MTGTRTPSGLERDERWARVAWSFLVEPRSGPLVRYLATHGAVESLAHLREGRYASTPELGVRLGMLDLVPMNPQPVPKGHGNAWLKRLRFRSWPTNTQRSITAR